MTEDLPRYIPIGLAPDLFTDDDNNTAPTARTIDPVNDSAWEIAVTFYRVDTVRRYIVLPYGTTAEQAADIARELYDNGGFDDAPREALMEFAGDIDVRELYPYAQRRRDALGFELVTRPTPAGLRCQRCDGVGTIPDYNSRTDRTIARPCPVCQNPTDENA